VTGTAANPEVAFCDTQTWALRSAPAPTDPTTTVDAFHVAAPAASLATLAPVSGVGVQVTPSGDVQTVAAVEVPPAERVPTMIHPGPPALGASTAVMVVPGPPPMAR